VATQTRNPTVLVSDGSGVVAWVNTADAVACQPPNGGPYANASYGAMQFGTSDNLVGTGCGFAIPLTATINGVTADFMRHESGPDVFDSNIMLMSGGLPAGLNRATAAFWPALDAVLSVGGAADLWGVAWTPALINAVDFGCQIAIDNTSGSVGGFIGCFTITVTFTPAAATSRPGFLLRGVSPS
jgi:hypothetical protein